MSLRLARNSSETWIADRDSNFVKHDRDKLRKYLHNKDTNVRETDASRNDKQANNTRRGEGKGRRYGNKRRRREERAREVKRIG